MSANEKVTAGKVRGRSAEARPGRGRARGARVSAGDGQVKAAFRIPRQLHSTMTQESRGRHRPHTVRESDLRRFLHYFGLPSIIRANLERDREALGFSPYGYLQYVLYRRHEAVAENGEAFDRVRNAPSSSGSGYSRSARSALL